MQGQNLNLPLSVKLTFSLNAHPDPLTVMFCSCDKVVLSLEVMHLTKVKSDPITALVREECCFAGLCSIAKKGRQRLGDNVLMS